MTQLILKVMPLVSLILFVSASVSAGLPASTLEPIRSDYKKGEVEALCTQAIRATTSKLDAIAKIQQGSFAATVLAFETITAELSDATLPLTFMGYVSTDGDVRGEGASCEEAVNQFYVEILTRKDLYVALKGAVPGSAEETRLLSETLKSFEANGLKLSDDKLAQVKALKQKLAVAESQFGTNLNNDATTVELTQAELKGLPADYVSALKKSPDGVRFVVPTRESDYSVFLPNASSAEARRKWLLGYYNRQGVANTQLLESAIALRQQIAALMGYSTWADYRTQGRMAKSARTVLDFLNSLRDKLAAGNRRDMAQLLKFKQELDPSATAVDQWDINYLSYQLKKRDYALDTETIREYFPADVVVSGIFETYSKLLGVKFVEVTGAKTWNSDVKLYRIRDAGPGERVIGYFYTDLVPRANKYGHAAAFPLVSGRRLPDGSYTLPVASIVANLAAPSAGKPSLLSHDDVVTFFHEFGHIMHQTLTRAPYASLSGSTVAQDFVEAPSQMLENWPWDPGVLNTLSGHYLDHSKKLPADLLKRMVAAREFQQSYYYTRQLTLGLVDMTYHTASGPVDTAAVYDRLHAEIIGVPAILGGRFAASFGHLMGGYDAGYYGYLWSKVYAEDMFTRFDKEGVLNSATGADYRRVILEKGGMVDALDLVREFIGREPNSDAFFKSIGVGSAK
jgi:thimet oligopeptidase